ncbi:MAG: acylneuraminate cytidylyltransferase family protein [Nitrospira sp.]|nr:acylneuraminate cytidylyltransferase family protein [Nitrospira sp.]
MSAARHVLGVIPARGGSKSIPLKNIRPLNGMPLLAYTIQTAKQSTFLDRCVVSTDHADIAAVARAHGAEVIDRPAELATDQAPTEGALLQVLEVLGRQGYRPEFVVTLEPTSPFRTTTLIDRCIATAIEQQETDCVLTVTETRKCYGRLVDGRFEYLFPNQPRRRQEREPLYEESSTVYVTRTTALERDRSVLGRSRVGVVVADSREALDINEPLDFLIAEAVLTQRRLEEQHG